MVIRTVILALSFYSTSAFSNNEKDVDVINSGKVHLRGAITQNACTVATNSYEQIVNMGSFRSNQFDGVGSYAPPVEFDIQLTDCHATIGQKVMINFAGVTDVRDPQVLRAGVGANAATGVGLAIFDRSGDIITPNSLPKNIDHLLKGDMSLRFIARYRATSNEVKGGNADAWTWFILSYQ